MKPRAGGGLTVGAITVLMSIGGAMHSGSTAKSAREPSIKSISLQRLGSFAQPIATAIRPGHSEITVAEKAGTVRLLNPDASVAPTPVIDISADTASRGEQGLLGLAYSPDGSQIYLDYTDGSGNSHVVRWTLDSAGIADPATRHEILHQDQPYPNHNGGNILFGRDGALYIGFGDGGSGGDPKNRAQNAATWLGKILRIAVAHDATPEIWVTGVRNPWRFSFDPFNNDLWVGDVGQNAWEEIDVLPAPSGSSEPGGRGANLGWKLMEGTHKFSDGDTSGMTPPVWDYNHDDGNCSVTGGVVYRGTSIPGLNGKYLFADYCEGHLRVLTPAGTRRADVRQPGLQLDKPVSFGYDATGEILICSLSGGVYRLVAA